MAALTAPTEPADQLNAADPIARRPSLASRLGTATRALALPIASILFAFAAGAIVVAATGHDPVLTYSSLICGGLGIGCPDTISPTLQLSSTIVNATPLILTGIAVALSFRAGLFNIGAEGQLVVGSIAATVVGVNFESLPGFLLVPLLLLAGALAGAVWGGIVGVLKATVGAHEVVTTIMLNYVALYLVDFLVVGGPFEQHNFPANSPGISASAELPRLISPDTTLFGLPGGAYGIHAGIFVALAAAVVLWFLLQRMTLGYEIRAVGQSQRAAQYAGISVRRTIIVTMLISGAFAGIAGAVQISGVLYHFSTNTFKTDTTGFDAIAVALLGQNTAIGVVLSAILFGALHAGSQLSESVAGVPGNLVDILQAFVLFSVAANFLRTFRIRLPALGQRPPTTPDALPPAELDNAADEDALERLSVDGSGTA